MNTQMERYRATRDFGMGDMAIQRGMPIDFDGYNIRVAGRPQQAMPSFKGAVKARWAVPEAEYNASAPPARPQSAGIKVRPADTGNPNSRQASTMAATAQAEENIVSDVATHAAGVRKANNARTYKVTSQEVEPQDGVPVRTLQTLANSKDGMRTTITAANSYQAIQAANNVQIEAGRGLTREELMERMTPEQRATYQAEIEARRAMHVPLDSRVAVQGPSMQGEIVASLDGPDSVDSMGIHLENSVGGGTDTVDLSGLDQAPAELQTVEVEGMRFRTTNGPRKNGAVQAAPQGGGFEDMDPRRVIARSICRDFPEQYDFNAPARKKLARLRADFEDRHDVIRAVAAAETDAEVKSLLVGEFPEAFQV